MKSITAHNAKLGFNWESDSLYFVPAGGKHWTGSSYKGWIQIFARWVSTNNLKALTDYAYYALTMVQEDFTL